MEMCPDGPASLSEMPISTSPKEESLRGEASATDSLALAPSRALPASATLCDSRLSAPELLRWSLMAAWAADS